MVSVILPAGVCLFCPRRSCVQKLRAVLHDLLPVLPGPDDHLEPMNLIASKLNHFGDYLRETCGLSPAACYYALTALILLWTIRAV